MRYSHQGVRRAGSTGRHAKQSDNPRTESLIVQPATAPRRPGRQTGNIRRASKQRRQSAATTVTHRGRKLPVDSVRVLPEASSEPVEHHSYPINRLVAIKPSDSHYRCKICGTHFERQTQLKTHLLEHSNERPYPCFTCNIRFTTKWNLMKHQKCRSHRVVQARVAGNTGADRAKPTRFIPIKKRKVDWNQQAPLLCQADSGASEPNESKSAAKESISLNVLPFSSPIATQLQASQLNQLNGELKPVLIGILQLDLPNDRAVRIPVSVKAEELKQCLGGGGTTITATPLGPATNKTEEKVPAETQKSAPDSNQRSQKPLPKIAKETPPQPVPCSMGSGCSQLIESDPLNTRTQEELQAARIILSLANSRETPSEQLHCQPQTSNNSTVSFSVGHCDLSVPARSQATQTSLTSSTAFSQSRSPTPQPQCDNSLSRMQNNKAVPDQTSLPACCIGSFNGFRPNWSSDLMIETVPSSKHCIDSPSEPSSQCETRPSNASSISQDLSTQNSTSPVGSNRFRKHHGAIRPPPKKRLSVHYQRTPGPPVVVSSSTPTATSTDLLYVCSNVSCTSESWHPTTPPKFQVASASVTFSAPPATPSIPTAVVKASGNGIPIVGLSNAIPVTVIPKTLQQNPSPSKTCPLSPQPIAPSPLQSFPPPSHPTGIQYGCSLPSSPNVVILPPLMFLPRIISPYLPVAASQSMVTSCFLVQPNTAVRGQCTLTSTVTDALVTPIPTALREPTSTTTGSTRLIPPGNRFSEHSMVAILPKEPSVRKSVTPIPAESLPSLGPVLQSAGTSVPSVTSPSKIPSTSSGPNLETVSTSSIASTTTLAVRTTSDTQSPNNAVSSKPSETASRRLVAILPSQPAVNQITPTSTDRTSSSQSRPLFASRLLACRNKYRCYECGLVCHKPCLLRKHYRTHSNLRPYLCPHCDVSFKTRGNLSKHMKSRGHYDRCVRDLGLEQAPLVVDDATQVDRQALERQRQLTLKKDNVKRELRRSRFRAIKANPNNSIGRARRIALATKPFREQRRRRQSKNGALRSDSQIVTSSTSPIPPVSSPYISSVSTTPGLDFSNRIPAPNVNAVHLLQDLPLNLSLRPREATVVIPHQLDSATPGVRPITSLINTPSTPTSQSGVSSALTALDAEEIVRTAVAAARTLSHEKPHPVSSTTTLVAAEQAVPPHAFNDRGSSSISTSLIHRTRTSVQSNSVQSPAFSHTLVSPNRTPPSVVHSLPRTLAPQPTSSNSGTTSSQPTSPATRIVTSTHDLYSPPKSSYKPVETTVDRNTCDSLTSLPLLPRRQTDPQSEGRRTSSTNSRPRDPRPYKCTTCQIGFRVTGHLHKHYRAKSHLVCVLQSHNLSLDTIESVHHNRFNISQIVNPDTGQLRMRVIERLQTIQPSPNNSQSTPPVSSSSGTE